MRDDSGGEGKVLGSRERLTVERMMGDMVIIIIISIIIMQICVAHIGGTSSQ